MNPGFNKLKRRVKLYTLFRSALLGGAVSLALLAVLMTVLKLSSVDLHPVVYALSGVAASIVLSVAFTLILSRSDRQIAKQIDEDLSLNERVRTMIAFRDEEGDVIAYQREDTEMRLSSLGTRRIRPRRLVSALIIFLIAASMLVGSLFVPLSVVAEPEETPIGDFEHKWIVDRLNALIEVVDRSFLEEDIKEIFLKELNALVDTVLASEKMSEMKAAAIATLINIDRTAEQFNTATDLAKELSESNTEVLSKLGDELSTLSGSAVKKQMKKLKSYITGAEEPTEAAYGVAEEIDAYLRVADIPLDDDLYKVFKAFAISLLAVSDSGNVSALDVAFDAVDSELPDILLSQRDNRSTADTVIGELALIFGITEDDLLSTEGGSDVEIDKTPTTQPLPPEDDEEIADEGGYAEGGNSYASDDLVYSPELGKYVSYGEIFDLYFGKYNDKRLDGAYEEELLELLKAYFDALY